MGMQGVNRWNCLDFSEIGTNWGWLTIPIVGQGLQVFMECSPEKPGSERGKPD